MNMTRRSNITSYLPSEADVQKFQMLSSLFRSVYSELKTFSSKKPDEPMNKFKVSAINRILTQLREFLATQPTIAFLDSLDDATMPSNSDAVLVLAQYEAAMDHFKATFHRYDETEAEHRWSTKENPIRKFRDLIP